MDPLFLPYIEHLHSKMEALTSMVRVTPMSLPKLMCKKGVYLLSEGDLHFYVGRNNHIKQRLSRHCRPGATHRMAAFAFRLAREETGNLKATYKKGAGSRAALVTEERFLKAFTAAKALFCLAALRPCGSEVAPAPCPLAFFAKGIVTRMGRAPLPAAR